MIKTQPYVCLLTDSHCIQLCLDHPHDHPQKETHSHTCKKHLLASHVCLSSYISSVPPGWIFIKFYVIDFYENLSKKFAFNENMTKISGTLDKDLSMFYCCWQLKSP
jgi:hypothetical protein